MKKFLLCIVFLLGCFILCGCDNENKTLVKLPVTKEPTVEYSCMMGDVLEGNICVHETKTTAILQWECQPGYTLYGSQCRKTGGIINIAKCGANRVEYLGSCYINISAVPKYVCYSGTLDGVMCINRNVYTPTEKLVCEEGFVLNEKEKCEEK